jgi:cyanophycinase
MRAALKLMIVVSAILAGCGQDQSDAVSDVASSDAMPTSGPASGSLVVAGGNIKDLTIFERFVALAGGLDAPIVVVPTAAEGDINELPWDILAEFREIGANNLTILHTRDPAEADTDAFVEPLKNARGVWFIGGRQWRIADSYLGTRAEQEFRNVLERGGVIGGSSAGATIQGSYLARGDSKTNTIMMGDHEEGFAYIRNVAIDQHVLARNRQFDLLEIIDAHPELLGLGIDENTAIIVEGDSFEVIGQGYVAIYDSNKTTGRNGRFYFLAPGDQFNMRKREPLRPGDDSEPFAIIK